jgi:hypothetical protein
MRRFTVLVCFALLVVTAGFAARSHAATTGTEMIMTAKYDTKSPIQGTVTLAQVNASGSNTVVATATLSNGEATVTVPLAANAVYEVTLTSLKGAQLMQFPITTAMINPTNLESAEIDIVMHAANNSLVKARMIVNMNF